MGRLKMLERKQQKLIIGERLHRPRILITRSGIFWGKRGDWLLGTNGHEWIVEGVMFDNLYEVVDHD